MLYFVTNTFLDNSFTRQYGKTDRHADDMNDISLQPNNGTLGVLGRFYPSDWVTVSVYNNIDNMTYTVVV